MTTRGLVLAVTATLLVSSSVAQAQVIGTFTWQTQPFCNRITATVVQVGASYQLTGTDNRCGGTAAPVTGTAVQTGLGVALGLSVALPAGRATDITANITLATLSGTWTDGGGNTGAFAFNGAAAGAVRPDAGALTVNKLLSAVVGDTGVLARGTSVVSTSQLGTGHYGVIFDRDVSACVFTATPGTIAGGVLQNRQATTARLNTDVNGVFVRTEDSTGALANASFHLVVVCP